MDHKKIRLSGYIDCTQCGARHLEKPNRIDSGKPVFMLLVIFCSLFIGAHLDNYLGATFGLVFGKIAAFFLAGFSMVAAFHFFSPKYGEPKRFIVEKVGSPVTRDDVKIVFCILVALGVASILLWQIPSVFNV